MINKYKKHSLALGLIFTIASALFSYVMTCLIYSDVRILERISDSLYDCGVDAIGTLICAALYYGSMKQEGDGAKAFRTLNVMVCASFVLNFLMYSTSTPSYNVLTFIFILLSKLIDLGLIYYFYQFVRIMLGFEGKFAEWA